VFENETGGGVGCGGGEWVCVRGKKQWGSASCVGWLGLAGVGCGVDADDETEIPPS